MINLPKLKVCLAVSTVVATVIDPTTTFAQSARSSKAAPPRRPPATTMPPAKAASDMQAVLDQLAVLGSKPVELLTPEQARLNPGAADAAKAAMVAKGVSTIADPSVTTSDVSYGNDPKQFARIYKPAAVMAGAAMPVIVYYHGGGWVIATVDTYDSTPRMLAKQLGAIVVSVEYRLAPEAKFPSQHDDAATAYRWALKHAASWGGDLKRLALAGESAGGNLAVATAIYARDNHILAPVHILAIYPIANSSTTLPSRKDSANAKPLNAAMLSWFGYYYATTKADQTDPRINLVKADLKGLPPTTIINAQIDPLRSDGETLAAAMTAAGGTVEQRTFPGVTHEMFGMGMIVKGAHDSNLYAIKRLKTAFSMSSAR